MRDDELCQQLLMVMQRATGVPSLSFEGEPVRLRGGFWADLFAFRLRGAPAGWDHDLVARVMPDAALACKETLIQADVAAAGYPTPVVRASGGEGDGLERAFMVMDHAVGSPLLAGLEGVPVTRLPRLAASIPETLASTMARLHDLDAEPMRMRLADACPVSTSVEQMLLAHWR